MCIYLYDNISSIFQTLHEFYCELPILLCYLLFHHFVGQSIKLVWAHVIMRMMTVKCNVSALVQQILSWLLERRCMLFHGYLFSSQGKSAHHFFHLFFDVFSDFSFLPLHIWVIGSGRFWWLCLLLLLLSSLLLVLILWLLMWFILFVF